MAQPTLACVVWNDAHSSKGTIEEHEIEHKPYVFTSVGYLVKSDDVGVSLAFEQGQDGKWRDITFIPRVMIQQEWSLGPLKHPRPRKKAEPIVPLPTTE